MLCAQARSYQALRLYSDPLAPVLPATTGALVALSSNLNRGDIYDTSDAIF